MPGWVPASTWRTLLRSSSKLKLSTTLLHARRATNISFRDLFKIDESVHWFCPRIGPHDPELHYDEDVGPVLPNEPAQEKVARQKKVKEAEQRREDIFYGVRIMAFDGPEAVDYQEKLKACLKTQLTRCDICIREYHRARSQLELSLEGMYDREDVTSFMERYDDMNKDRIAEGLRLLTDRLNSMPAKERKIQNAGDVGMFAMFEALNCVPFLKDEQALQRDFDGPFALVQQNRRIRLPSYCPGMGAFFFAPSDSLRWEWAGSNFQRVKHPLTSTHFEMSFKSFVEGAIARVDIKSLDQTFLPKFWRGMNLLISRFSKSMVAQDLRSMERNLFTTGLEHFQLDDSHIQDELDAFAKLLELSPHDFWEAMGTVPAQAVAQNICASPVLDRLMRETVETDSLQLTEKLKWVTPFLRSIKPVNLVPPTNTLLDLFLQHFQTTRYSEFAREAAWLTGIECLQESLVSMRRGVKGGLVIQQMIEGVVVPWFEIVMGRLAGVEKKSILEPIDMSYLSIIEQSLALDVQSLANDRAVIEENKTIDHDLAVSGLKIWKTSLRGVEKGNPYLPKAILSGITGLLSLEKFSSRQMSVAPKFTEKWNNALDRVLTYVVDSLLGGLSNLLPAQSRQLLMDQPAATGLMSLLFSGNADVHAAALNVIKEMTEQDSRREALRHLTEHHAPTVITAIIQTQKSTVRAKSFAPCSMLLKVCSEIFDALCNSRDGLLRSQDLPMEWLTLREFWTWTWNVTSTMFAETENWAFLGYAKSMMAEFCRETLDFADFLFDQYSVVASALESEVGHEATRDEIAGELMKRSRIAFEPLTRWLRLRDEWLIDKAVSLASKMLGRLRDVGIKVDPASADFVQRVITSQERQPGYVKTKLTQTHKAELQRALEKYLGESIAPVVELEPALPKPKQSSLQGWASSGSGTASALSKIEKPKKNTLDMNNWQSTAQKQKQNGVVGVGVGAAATTKRPENKLAKQLAVTSAQSVQAAQQNSTKMSEFKAKRLREQEEAAKRKAAFLAKSKGTGAGTGVQNLGNLGKDHSMPGQQLMISSDDSDDDDDEDDDDADLFGPNPNAKKERKANMPNVENIKAEIKKPMRIQRAQRSARDMRARLKPDLGPLHKVILKWDFFHTGDYPPGANEHQFKKVANIFNDPTTYQSTFQPLLTLEAWQGLVRSREENSSRPFEIKISSRSNVDGMIEIGSLISHEENRNAQLQEGDIVLLSKSPKPAQDAQAPNALARIYKIKRQKIGLEIVYQTMPNGTLPQHLTTQAVVHGIKITSITPLEREYGALQALQYYDLCNQITRAKPSPKIDYTEKQIQTCQDVWNVNRAQSEAINAAMENEGFSLIQGPPGSGKTKTIIAIVGGLLSNVLSQSNGATRINVPKPTNGAQVNSMDAAPKKLLVCAPSNAAVDELVMRLKEGVKTRSGKHYPLNVVRIGRSEAINQQVVDVTMEELVQKRLGNNTDPKEKEKNKVFFDQHKSVSDALREMQDKRDKGEVKGAEAEKLHQEITAMRRKRAELATRIEAVKDAEQSAAREGDLSKKRAQQAVLDNAHVICATLSGSGHDMFQNVNIEFETVVIDEAAQCVEMSSLIPLKYGCIKCIMVGDPKQLPPTVFSKEAARFQYEQSLFVRMQNNAPNQVHLLDTQYRMHPEISAFPSRTFYDSLLKDGEGMAPLRKKAWHSSAILAPYRFFDVKGQHQMGSGHSLINHAEIKVAMALIDRLTTDYKDHDFNGQIGIITPYKAQLRALKESFSRQYGNGIFDMIEFNTTDAFQGRESEIIIFSCVRASPAGGVGFLQDIRRMNVGLTRAKSSLWVLGNSESLVRGQFWRKLLEDAQARDCYSTGNVLQMLSTPSSKFPAANANLRAMADVDAHVPQMGMGVTGVNGTDTGTGAGDGSGGAVAQGDRMEGVTRKLQDHLAGAKKRQAEGDANAARSKTSRAASTAAVDDEDVEMSGMEAEEGGGRTAGGPSETAEPKAALQPSRKSNAFIPRKPVGPKR